MKKKLAIFSFSAALCFAFSGCIAVFNFNDSEGGTPSSDFSSVSEYEQAGGLTEETGFDKSAALTAALEYAGVSKEDAYNIKVERDEEGAIAVFKVEFETDYGDYGFEISISDQKIIGADYEIDEEWLKSLGGAPVTIDEAQKIALEKVPGAGLDDIRIWAEGEGGSQRFEGEAYYDSIKYEFEIDPDTGIIFDFSADLRE